MRSTSPDGFWESVRRLLPVTRTAMEFCWVSPWLVVMGGGLYGSHGHLLSAGWAFLLMIGAQVLVQPVVERTGTLRGARMVLVGVGAALGLAAVHQQYYAQVPLWHPAWLWMLLRATHDALPAIPQPVAGAFLASCLWWRGLALGVRQVGAIDIEQAYKTGVGMIVFYLVAAAIYADTRGFQAAGPDLPASMLVFFFLGLSALALARLAAIWDVGRAEERAQVPGRAWMLLVVGVVGLILLSASAMAGLAAADVTRYLVIALRPLLPLVEIVFIVLFFIAGLLVRVIIAVLSHLPRRELPEVGPPPSFIDDLLRRLREIEMDPQVVEGARWGMVAAFLAVLILGMAVTIVLMRRKERKKDEDERESVWSVRDLLAGLAGLLPRPRFRRPQRERSVREAGAIRRIYRELLQVGAGLGAPRPAWATPREHGPRLQGALPGAVSEVEALTWAYERVRYGRWRPAPADVRDAEAALERVKAAAEPGPAAGPSPEDQRSPGRGG
ncbi:MAG: DUF4129 domain-containing protein [Armatimonadetes bacterium]|nr:DUF4129 domain-containing protein [Armatimonadota bacterium]